MFDMGFFEKSSLCDTARINAQMRKS